MIRPGEPIGKFVTHIHFVLYEEQKLLLLCDLTQCHVI
jgi:hypothetical protein